MDSKLYVYVDGKFEIFTSNNDARIEFSEFAPDGQLKLHGKGKKAGWKYRPYGYSQQECLDNVNIFTLREIAKLQSQIEALQKRLVKAPL